MTREMEIEILMEDRCTKSEAEKHLKNGTIIFDDFEENFDKYMEEWKYLADDEEEYTINVFKAEKVSKVENRVSKTKTMSYTKKEIVKYIIITISCTLIFFFYKLVFISKTTLNVLPNTLRN